MALLKVTRPDQISSNFPNGLQIPKSYRQEKGLELRMKEVFRLLRGRLSRSPKVPTGYRRAIVALEARYVECEEIGSPVLCETTAR